MGEELHGWMRRLAEADRRATIWSTCQCVRTVLHLIPEGERSRARRSRWSRRGWRGGASKGDCKHAARDAARAVTITAEGLRRKTFEGSPRRDLAAAEAAASAARAAYQTIGIVAAQRRARYADLAYYAANAAASAAAWAACPDRDSQDWGRGRDQHLAQLHALICSLTWPRATPTPQQRQGALPKLRVAWDAICAVGGELTLAELIVAHEHAALLDLIWEDPIERAIAERVEDLDAIDALLHGRPRRSAPAALGTLVEGDR